MKRIKVAQNRFFKLLRLESETGVTISYELIRITRFPFVPIAVFRPNDWKKAGRAFTIATCVLKTAGLRLHSKTISRIVDRSADFTAGNRHFKSRQRKRKRNDKSYFA